MTDIQAANLRNGKCRDPRVAPLFDRKRLIIDHQQPILKFARDQAIPGRKFVGSFLAQVCGAMGRGRAYRWLRATFSCPLVW